MGVLFLRIVCAFSDIQSQTKRRRQSSNFEDDEQGENVSSHAGDSAGSESGPDGGEEHEGNDSL